MAKREQLSLIETYAAMLPVGREAMGSKLARGVLEASIAILPWDEVSGLSWRVGLAQYVGLDPQEVPVAVGMVDLPGGKVTAYCSVEVDPYMGKVCLARWWDGQDKVAGQTAFELTDQEISPVGVLARVVRMAKEFGLSPSDTLQRAEILLTSYAETVVSR